MYGSSNLCGEQMRMSFTDQTLELSKLRKSRRIRRLQRVRATTGLVKLKKNLMCEMITGALYHIYFDFFATTAACPGCLFSESKKDDFHSSFIDSERLLRTLQLKAAMLLPA